MNNLFRVNSMNLNALRDDLHRENESGATLAILSETEEDVLTSDFDEDRDIPYHLVPVTKEWLAGRFLWTPDAAPYRAKVEGQLLQSLQFAAQVDPNMFICLNCIIVTTNSDDDSTFIAKSMDVEECELPDYWKDLGTKWHYSSSIVVNVSAIEEAASEELALSDGERTALILNEIGVTLLHELRHLGLDCNPFLDESLYPDYDDECSEAYVEEWARFIANSAESNLKM